MKLYYSLTSPYSRKVCMVIQIKGLEAQVEKILINPFTEVTSIIKINPLGKIPALKLDNGEILFDSPVICDYLDQLSPQIPLTQFKDWSYWEIKRWQAIADGLTDIAYCLVVESRRLKTEQSSTCIKQWNEELQQTLNYIEKKVQQLKTPTTLAHISLASALGYLEFRLPDRLFSAKCPKTIEWLNEIKLQTFMIDTQPQD